MRKQPIYVTGVSIVLVVTGMAVTPASAGSQSVCPPGISRSGVLTPDNLPDGSPVAACDLVDRVIVGDSVAVRVPPPGYGVTSFETYPDGRNAEFGLYTASNGQVHYVLGTGAPADETAAQATVLASPSACSDTAYETTNQKDSAWGWYLGDGAMPTNMTRADARTALDNTNGAMEDSYNDCGLADQLSLTLDDNGDTTTESEIDTADGASTCENYIFIDNYNTVDFGNLDNHNDPPLAKTCTWWIPGASSYTSQDIRFNVTDFDWTRYPNDASCSNDYDLRGVAMHEFGHALGMKHVSESDHGNLTMSTETAPCDASQRTLGKGDVLGLRTKY